MVLAVSPSVAHNLEPPNHFTNAEKADGFGSHDTDSQKCIGVQVPYSRKKALLGVQTNVLCPGREGSRIADRVCKGRNVALDRFNRPVCVNGMV